jgi:hypothetical protein
MPVAITMTRWRMHRGQGSSAMTCSMYRATAISSTQVMDRLKYTIRDVRRGIVRYLPVQVSVGVSNCGLLCIKHRSIKIMYRLSMNSSLHIGALTFDSATQHVGQ